MDFLGINEWYSRNSLEWSDIITNTSIDATYVKVNNYVYGNTFTYSNPLHSVNDGTRIWFKIHPNISFYVFVHNPKYVLIGTNPSLFPGFFQKYKVCLNLYDFGKLKMK